MEHLRAFITATLSICAVMLKRVWWCVSITLCVSVTLAGLTTLYHSHCCLINSQPSCSPSAAWDLTGWSSAPPLPPLSSLLSSPLSPDFLLFYLPLSFLPSASLSSPNSSLLSFLHPQCQLIRGVRTGQYKDLIWPTLWPHSSLFWAIISGH